MVDGFIVRKGRQGRGRRRPIKIKASGPYKKGGRAAIFGKEKNKQETRGSRYQFHKGGKEGYRRSTWNCTGERGRYETGSWMGEKKQGWNVFQKSRKEKGGRLATTTRRVNVGGRALGVN